MKERGSKTEKKRERKIERYYITGFEDGAWGYKPKSASSLLHLKKVRKWILSLEPPEGTQVC